MPPELPVSRLLEEVFGVPPTWLVIQNSHEQTLGLLTDRQFEFELNKFATITPSLSQPSHL